MFKSKVKMEAFDQNNEKVQIEPAKQKNLCKAGVKKLTGQKGVKTSYHLILDYFKDDKGKPQGHFLDVGEHKKLTKHFEQIEMKSGKPDKRMSASQKEASAGEIYVEDKDGKTLVHFEPSPKCKIPSGKWPKIIKALKAMLGGLKGIAIIGGIVVQDDEESTEEGTEAPTDETTTEEETGEESTSDVDTETSEQNRKKREKTLNTMEERMGTMNKVVGKISRSKLNGNITKYEEALAKLIKEAEADNIVTDEEQQHIDRVKEQLDLLKQNVEENGSRLQPEHRERMRTNLETAKQQLDQLLAEMGI